MVETYFFQSHNFPPGGVGECRVETLGAVDLSVGPFADLFEAAVVCDCSGGERPAVDGILTECGGDDFGIVMLLCGCSAPAAAALFVERQAVEAIDAAWIFARR